MTERGAYVAADAADPLQEVRERFELPDGVIYLDGNSLGALPRHVPARLQTAVIDEWGRDLITSWNRHGWVDLPRRVGDRIAQLIGVGPGTVVAGDSTSINLFKAVSAARTFTDRSMILSDSGNFPTDLYVMSGIGELRLVEPDDVLGAIDDDVGVVALTHVGYATGRMHDMEAVTRAVHEAGALMVWDLAHSAGAMDLQLGDSDFAVGCGYKYLNGGPGAPGFIYVRPDLLDEVRNPITGWFGHAAPFDFELEFRPTDGIGRMEVGTPHVLSLIALDAALEAFDGVGMAAVRAKSVVLTESFIELVRRRDLPLRLVSPVDPGRRGSQVCLAHPHGYAIIQALIERGVVGDFRAPDVIRLGFAPLYLRHVDVFDAVAILADVVDSEAFRDPRFSVRHTVT
jgi:kynureninase